MSGTLLFTPKTAGTVNIAGTTSTARVALVKLGCDQLRIKNLDTTNTVFVNFGDVTVVATLAASMPVGPGEVVGVTMAADWTHVAALTSTSTATVYFTPGNGL